MIIEKTFVSLQPFVISIKDLGPGESHYEWQAGAEFFEAFETSEVIDADLYVEVDVDCDDDSIEIRCTIDGSVIVICDRCLERLELPVETGFELDDDEIDHCRDIDLRQDIYDYVCISLPMQRVHPEGECNEETVKYLSK